MFAFPTNKKTEEPSFSILDDRNSLEKKNIPMKPEYNRFPFCIVWTTIPIFFHLIPCIGHTGICE